MAVSQSNPITFVVLIVIIVVVVFLKKSGFLDRFKSYDEVSDHIVSYIEELNKAYKNGEITKDEYEKEKREIISKM